MTLLMVVDWILKLLQSGSVVNLPIEEQLGDICIDQGFTEQEGDLPIEEQLGDLCVDQGFTEQEDVVDNTFTDNAFENENIIVVKDKKGGQRVYDVNRVDDGNEYEDLYFQSDEDDVDYMEENDDNESVEDDDVSLDDEVVASDGRVDKHTDVRDEISDGRLDKHIDDPEPINAQQEVDITSVGDIIAHEWDREYLMNTARIEEKLPNFDSGSDLVLFVGQRWDNIKICRKFIRYYAITKKFAIIFPKNNSDKIVAVCREENCKFRVYVRRMNDNHTMRLTKLEDKHSCVSRTVTRNPTATAPWIASKIEEQMRRHHKSFTPLDVQERMWSEYCVQVLYWQAWSARLLALEAVYGNYEKRYARLPELCRQVLNTNPGSLA
ncbi:Mudr family transposase, partial [Thalictrum thalictroides]